MQVGQDNEAKLESTPDGPFMQRLMLHYASPPFATGEVGPGNRDRMMDCMMGCGQSINFDANAPVFTARPIIKPQTTRLEKVMHAPFPCHFAAHSKGH